MDPLRDIGISLAAAAAAFAAGWTATGALLQWRDSRA
jgi:hypothetical protein